MFRSRRLRFGIVPTAFIAFLALMVGVASGTGFVAAQDGDAQVRIVHASPDAPAVDIWVDGDVAVEGLEFGSATDLIALPAGSYDVAVTATGDDLENAVIEATLDLEGGAAYEVAAVGFLDNIGAQVYPLNLSVIGEGQARVRVVHASPDAPAVDIALADGTILIDGLEFPNASDSLEVDAGSYDLQVLASGTDTVALDLPGVAFDAGTVYSIYAIGSLDEGTLSALPLTAPAETAAGGESDSGVGSTTTTTPSTGIGSTVAEQASFGWLLAAAALLLVVAGAYLRRDPVGARSR